MAIKGTPTFFINGIKVVGAQPYEVFEQIIEPELEALGCNLNSANNYQ